MCPSPAFVYPDVTREGLKYIGEYVIDEGFSVALCNIMNIVVLVQF